MTSTNTFLHETTHVMASHPESTTLGSSDIKISPLGVGAWSWGDLFFWGYGREYKHDDARAAFEASLSSGINWIDTAEVYGLGKSERLVGEFIRDSQNTPLVATKFFPFPWRFRKSQLLTALRGSLRRLGLSQVDLYQIHMPLPPAPVETWAEALADAQQVGLTRAVGVSNFNLKQMRLAHSALVKRGVLLASNQVEYSLLDRSAETTGLLDACRELNITLIAYSPLGQGLLTGKYGPNKAPPGVRAQKYPQKMLNRLPPLIRILREIGHSHDGKPPAQVALNWLIAKGAVPIPGAKNLLQAQENIGALGWRLSEDEISMLDQASDSFHGDSIRAGAQQA